MFVCEPSALSVSAARAITANKAVRNHMCNWNNKHIQQHSIPNKSPRLKGGTKKRHWIELESMSKCFCQFCCCAHQSIMNEARRYQTSWQPSVNAPHVKWFFSVLYICVLLLLACHIAEERLIWSHECVRVRCAFVYGQASAIANCNAGPIWFMIRVQPLPESKYTQQKITKQDAEFEKPQKMNERNRISGKTQCSMKQNARESKKKIENHNKNKT